MTGLEQKGSRQRDIAGRPVNLEPALFSGPWSVRVPRERWALAMCLLSAPITIALIGLLFKAVTYSDMVLLIVAGMAYVSISRGRSLGSSIRVHGRQFPELHALVASVAERLGVPLRQIAVGGRSFGGRMCSMAVADGLATAALVLVSYPLHPPGKPDRPRTEHLGALAVPCLFVSGTRDAFGTRQELEAATGAIAGPVTAWFELRRRRRGRGEVRPLGKRRRRRSSRALVELPS